MSEEKAKKTRTTSPYTEVARRMAAAAKAKKDLADAVEKLRAKLEAAQDKLRDAEDAFESAKVDLADLAKE